MDYAVWVAVRRCDERRLRRRLLRIAANTPKPITAAPPAKQPSAKYSKDSKLIDGLLDFTNGGDPRAVVNANTLPETARAW